jgi:hypothetical protein
MGLYYNPPEEIRQVGRQLVAGYSVYEDLFLKLKEGEVIFSLADVFCRRNNSLSALFIENEEENMANLQGYHQGAYDILGYYAVPKMLVERRLGRAIPNPELKPMWETKGNKKHIFPLDDPINYSSTDAVILASKCYKIDSRIDEMNLPWNTYERPWMASQIELVDLRGTNGLLGCKIDSGNELLGKLGLRQTTYQEALLLGLVKDIPELSIYFLNRLVFKGSEGTYQLMLSRWSFGYVWKLVDANEEISRYAVLAGVRQITTGSQPSAS